MQLKPMGHFSDAQSMEGEPALPRIFELAAEL